MSGSIFISYRRDDASGSAGRLYDRLVAHFAEDKIFFDIDRIALGADFVSVIVRSIMSADIVLAVIGKSWLTAADENGALRLEDPYDFVRLEISTALERGKIVIPVLVDSASMPADSELPDDLKSLTRRNAAKIGHDSFNADAERLIRALQKLLIDVTAPFERKDEKGRRPKSESAPDRKSAEKNAKVSEAPSRRKAQSNDIPSKSSSHSRPSSKLNHATSLTKSNRLGLTFLAFISLVFSIVYLWSIDEIGVEKKAVSTTSPPTTKTITQRPNTAPEPNSVTSFVGIVPKPKPKQPKGSSHTKSPGGSSTMVRASKKVPSSSPVYVERLTVPETRNKSRRTIPLLLSIAPATSKQPISVRVRGLPDGARLSSGRDLTNGSWLLRRKELSGLSMTVPTGFSGSITLRAEVIDDETHEAVSPVRLLHVKVPPSTDATTTKTTLAAANRARSDNLLKGDQMMHLGDIASARLLYKRALKAGDPRAATAMGKSYDPVVYEQLKVRGVIPDAKLALQWYQRGESGGDVEALSYIEALNSWLKR